EEAAIGGVVREVPRNLVDEIIVVDNGSTDRTAEIAAAAGARVVREPTRGYGAARLAGALAAGDTDILVFLDGDRNEDPAELPLVLGPVLAGEADLVLGARVRRGASRGTLTLQQRLGNSVVTALVRALYGLSLPDIGALREPRRRRERTPRRIRSDPRLSVHARAQDEHHLQRPEHPGARRRRAQALPQCRGLAGLSHRARPRCLSGGRQLADGHGRSRALRGARRAGHGDVGHDERQLRPAR